MLGTQSPTKIASSTFPLMNVIFEKISERKAAAKSSLSVSVNIENMALLFGMSVD
jgi:hypothetical protein